MHTPHALMMCNIRANRSPPDQGPAINVPKPLLPPPLSSNTRMLRTWGRRNWVSTHETPLHGGKSRNQRTGLAVTNVLCLHVLNSSVAHLKKQSGIFTRDLVFNVRVHMVPDFRDHSWPAPFATDFSHGGGFHVLRSNLCLPRSAACGRSQLTWFLLAIRHSLVA